MKNKMDELKKAKLMYTVELAVFAVLFAILGILFLTDVIKVYDWKRWAFAIVTLVGGIWLIIDLFWTIFSPKRRTKNCLLDKIMVAPMATAIVVFDIVAFAMGWVNATGDAAEKPVLFFRLSIGIALCYYALVYAFQAIYHWNKPVPAIIEAANEEKAEKEDLAAKAAIPTEKVDGNATTKEETKTKE